MSLVLSQRRLLLFAIIRSPTLPIQYYRNFNSAQEYKSSKESPTGRSNEGFSVSFGPRVDKLLKSDRRKSRSGTYTTKKSAGKSEGADKSITSATTTQSTAKSSQGVGGERGNEEDVAYDSTTLEIPDDVHEIISQPAATTHPSSHPHVVKDRYVRKGISTSVNGSLGDKVKIKSQKEASSQATSASTKPKPATKLEPWQIQKGALERKFGEAGWNPRKKLSPDAIEGIRALHEQNPELYKTQLLAQQFKVSPEAIRRVLKSKWRPSPEKLDERRQRWARRHDRIWDQKAELGLRPPRVKDRQIESPDAFDEEVRAKKMLGQL